MDKGLDIFASSVENNLTSYGVNGRKFFHRLEKATTAMTTFDDNQFLEGAIRKRLLEVIELKMIASQIEDNGSITAIEYKDEGEESEQSLKDFAPSLNVCTKEDLYDKNETLINQNANFSRFKKAQLLLQCIKIRAHIVLGRLAYEIEEIFTLSHKPPATTFKRLIGTLSEVEERIMEIDDFIEEMDGMVTTIFNSRGVHRQTNKETFHVMTLSLQTMMRLLAQPIKGLYVSEREGREMYIDTLAMTHGGGGVKVNHMMLLCSVAQDMTA